MTAPGTLTVALILALSSNAVLLLLLLFQSTGQYFAGKQPPQQPSYSSGCAGCKPELSDIGLRINSGIEENRLEERPKLIFQNKNMEQEVSDKFRPEGLGYFLQHPELCKSQRCGVLLRMYRDYLRSSKNSGDSSTFRIPASTSLPSDRTTLKHLWPKDYKNRQRVLHYLLQQLALENEQREPNRVNPKNDLNTPQFSADDSDIPSFDRPGNDRPKSLSKSENTAKVDEYYKALDDMTQHRNVYQGDGVSQSYRSTRPGRVKRDAASPATPQDNLEDSEGLAGYRLEEVFSTFTESELEKFGPPVSEILMPALISFEVMVISEVEALSAGLVSHDLRLEKLEKAKLNWEERGEEPQADAQDNKTLLDEEQQVIAEGGILLGNLSGGLELLEEMGSGDGEVKLFPSSSTTTTTTTIPTTTAAPVHYNYGEDIYRSLSNVEQKMQNLENFNLMSDTILQEARLEVIKMDDKVTELDRKNRNLNVRTSMQTYRIGQLETFMGKSEVMLQTMMGSVSRQASKVEYIKDSLSEFKKELHAVTVEFGRQNQIANELRAADSYKAHDINEIRQSVLALEGRLNSLYRVLDQSADTVRMDVRTALDRVCATNGLSC